jgi:LPS-assembly lipoprotein
MSSRKPQQDWTLKAMARAISTAVVAGALLAGCADGGFRPMYGALGTSGQTEAKLAQIDIPIIPGRVGQRVRNELIFQSNGGEIPTAPIYRLEVVLKETLFTTQVRSTGESDSQVYMLDVTFKLIRIGDKQVVLQGSSFGRAAMERVSSIFANVQGRLDAENRAARTVAEDLRIRLAAFLSRPG